jgi:hypothetical protein
MDNRQPEYYDNSKIADYIKCPRLYYFSWEQKIEPEQPNINFKFGASIHLALAHFYYGLDFCSKYSNANVAQDEAIEVFKKDFSPWAEYSNRTKNMESGLLTLDTFFSNPGYWDFGEVIAVESTLKDPKIRYAGKVDLICEKGDELIIIDHKTQGRMGASTFTKWRQLRAFLGYTHLAKLKYPGYRVYTMLVNVMHIVKEPGIFRTPYRFSDFHLDEWRYTTEHIIARIDDDKAHQHWDKYGSECQALNWECNYQVFCDQSAPLGELMMPLDYRQKEEWYV